LVAVAEVAILVEPLVRLHLQTAEQEVLAVVGLVEVSQLQVLQVSLIQAVGVVVWATVQQRHKLLAQVVQA
jgi:hypothetical protein